MAQRIRVLSVGVAGALLAVAVPASLAQQGKPAPTKVEAHDPGGKKAVQDPKFNGRQVSGTANRAGDQGSQKATFKGDSIILKGEGPGSSVGQARDLPLRAVHPLDHRGDVDVMSAGSKGEVNIDMKRGGTTVSASGDNVFAGSASNAGRGSAAGVRVRGPGQKASAHSSPTGSNTVDCKVTGEGKRVVSPLVKIAFCTTPAATDALPVPPMPAGAPTMKLRVCTREVGPTSLSPESGQPLKDWVARANQVLKAKDPSASVKISGGKIVVAGPSPLAVDFSTWKPPFSAVQTVTVP
jgi:hypothetical protein